MSFVPFECRLFFFRSLLRDIYRVRRVKWVRQIMFMAFLSWKEKKRRMCEGDPLSSWTACRSWSSLCWAASRACRSLLPENKIKQKMKTISKTNSKKLRYSNRRPEFERALALVSSLRFQFLNDDGKYRFFLLYLLHFLGQIIFFFALYFRLLLQLSKNFPRILRIHISFRHYNKC